MCSQEKLLESKEDASSRQVKVDLDALRETDLPTVVTLCLKHIVKIEIKDAINDAQRSSIIS